MSLFQCENCGCVENTAYSFQGFKIFPENFDWTYAPMRRGMELCSACGPKFFKSGGLSKKGGQWHENFLRRYLPLGDYITDDKGNLAHRHTGAKPALEDYSDTPILKPIPF